jgi:hypothetical protein
MAKANAPKPAIFSQPSAVGEGFDTPVLQDAKALPR